MGKWLTDLAIYRSAHPEGTSARMTVYLNGNEKDSGKRRPGS